MVNAQQGDVHGDAREGVQARAVRIGAGGVQVIL